MGDTAPNLVHVVVFTDFECPVCRRMDSVLTNLMTKHPGRIALGLVHFPLTQHASARRAAALFECADQQGRAREAKSALFARQTTLAQLDLQEFATAIGSLDAGAFIRCASSTPSPRIDAGFALAKQLEVTGTPAFVVNGWLVDGESPEKVVARIEEELDRVVKR